MTEVSLTVQAARERVFAVLADGWSYASWVVGASHIRNVDDGWPAAGTRIHHSVGPWPLVVRDVTAVRAVEPPRMLELDARLWPFGAATVRLELDDVAPGVTRVRMSEQVVRGPARVLPDPAQALLLIPRNRESLRRLADIAEGRVRTDDPAEAGPPRALQPPPPPAPPTTLQAEAGQQDRLQDERDAQAQRQGQR